MLTSVFHVIPSVIHVGHVDVLRPPRGTEVGLCAGSVVPSGTESRLSDGDEDFADVGSSFTVSTLGLRPSAVHQDAPRRTRTQRSDREYSCFSGAP
jgi:hypothetical protein